MTEEKTTVLSLVTKDTTFDVNNFDKILKAMGTKGRYFMLNKFLFFFIITLAAMNIGSSSFTEVKHEYYCSVPKAVVENITKSCNITKKIQKLTNKFFPYVGNSSKISKCSRYTDASLEAVPCVYWSFENTTNSDLPTQQCTSWEFEVGHSTVQSTFSITCDDEWLLKLPGYAIMLGVFFGSFICGMASDHYGRAATFAVNSVLITSTTILSAFINNFYFYLVMRFLVGFSLIGSCESGYVYTMETTLKKHRILFGQIVESTFTVAFMILPLLAYFVRNWKVLTTIISLALLALTIPCYFLTYESPRWLFTKGKHSAAKEALVKMSKFNKSKVDFNKVQILSATPLQNDSLRTKGGSSPQGEQENLQVHNKPNSEETTGTIFKTPFMRNTTIFLCYNWFACTCSYYGLTLSSTRLNESPYVSFFLQALVEVPANFGAIPLMSRYGRRTTISAANFVSGLSLILFMFSPKNYKWLELILFLLGKFGVTAVFSCIYLYTSELYPTLLRGNGIGICSSFARIGGVISIGINQLVQYNRSLPYVIYGFMASLAALTILLLPETNNTKLPDSVEEAEKIYRTKRLKFFTKIFNRKHTESRTRV